MIFYTHEDVKKAVTLGKLKNMKHPIVAYCIYEKFDETSMKIRDGNFDAKDDLIIA